jgi:hypothetical protein
VQRKEIEECKKYLEASCNRIVDMIAYPYGNYNDVTLSVAEELNIKAGFITAERAVNNADQRLELGRIQVKNWNAKKFEANMNRWIKGFNF